MYPYHNRIIQRIKNNELIDIIDSYHHSKIGKCVLFVFNTPPYTRPIRYNAMYRYQKVLSAHPLSKKKNT
ncbi:MAG: hypothetical protein GX242_00590 [Clostridiales bacterium]|nr:hypothetical protein [Clostridiales bacterium]